MAALTSRASGSAMRDIWCWRPLLVCMVRVQLTQPFIETCEMSLRLRVSVRWFCQPLGGVLYFL